MATFGRFTLEEKLATGGMAEVWLAHVEGDPTPVVLKRVLPHLAENQSFNAMLLNEARVVMGLEHPNIVRVYEVGAVEGVTFISMEYVSGSDLALLMRRAQRTNAKVPLPIALRIIRSLCDALQAVHTAVDDIAEPLNLVHRDVSPQNVMISVAGATKLLDFGIVKAFNELALTEPGTIKGKFAYMSPEQAAGHPLDGRSDVFSAGLVAYELLSGVRAHSRDTEPGTYHAALEGAVAPLSKVWAAAPAELEAIIAKALSVAPEDRFQTAAELGSALELCAEAADEDEVARWSTSLIAARIPGATPLPKFSFEPNEPLLTVDARPPAVEQRIGRVELVKSAPSIDLPAEPNTVTEAPLMLPDDDEPSSLMPFAASSPQAIEAEPLVEDRPAASAPMRAPAPRSPYLWAGVVAVAVGLFGAIAALNDPLDGVGQWLAPVGCTLLVLAGALNVTRLFERRETLVALASGGVVLGLVRLDPLMCLVAGGFAAAMWFGTEDDDDHPLRGMLGLLAAGPAVFLTAVGTLGAWADRAPMAEGIAWLRRQATTPVTEKVELEKVMSFDPTGWRVRPSADGPGATEFALPPLRATLIARVLRVEGTAPTYESQLAQATADFAKRGWVDFVVAENNELTDEADESHLVSFRTRRGLTWSSGLLRMARVDDQLCVLIGVVAERRTVLARDELLRVTRSMRCSPGGATAELTPETLAAARAGLVTLRAGARVELGVVIQQRDKQVVILADDSILGGSTPTALTFRPLLKPSDELRRATVLRRKPGVLLLLADADEAMTPLSLVAPPGVEAEVVTVGLADDGVTSRVHVRPGALARKTATFEAHMRNTSGPVLTPGGALVGVLRAGEGGDRVITMASDVEALLSPGIRTLAWKLDVDDAHQCTLSIRVDLDDPFHELEQFAVLFGPPHQEEVLREEKVTGRTSSTLVATVPCPLEKSLSVGLRATGDGQVSKVVDAVQLPLIFPASRRGQRTDVSRPAVPDLTMLTWLFEPPAARAPVCPIEECDRVCGTGNGAACLALGQNLHNAGRAVLAINDYERGCVAKNFESCIQLTYLANAKTVDTYTAVLKPWCTLGVERACWALKVPQWREQVKKESAECGKSREACDREADLLLVGARRPADVQRARTALDRRCREGAPAVCLRAGLEWRYEGKMVEAADDFERACKGGVAEACVEQAGLMAVGVGAPRNVEAAARALRTACDRGSAEACSAIARPKP